ncbi:hypothetical protein BAE44_0021412 [Dichanthelium oligosanthes]|uniref:EF-hand domain-containing protein n=1 Tax=Dichanthelium oligosanthes TaxID=888268 RepID=A0A1E5UXF4_9POAL|nr:hypothetical protein BAE44_0021412 [Dichanthelium oligosanthes]
MLHGLRHGLTDVHVCCMAKAVDAQGGEGGGGPRRLAGGEEEADEEGQAASWRMLSGYERTREASMMVDALARVIAGGAPRPDPEADLGIVFSTFDHDSDGFITTVELGESLRRLGIAVSAEEAKAMHSTIATAGGSDLNGAREVPVEDTEEEAREEEERDLREAFNVFDGNQDGLISAEELGTVLGSLGLRRAGAGRPAVADCHDMIRLMDSDSDGMVSFEEFKRVMTVIKA